jgi:hypothetical protein
MEQKMTMVIRAVEDLCNVLYHGSITQEEGAGRGGSGDFVPLAGCNDGKAEQVLSTMQLPEN